MAEYGYIRKRYPASITDQYERILEYEVTAVLIDDGNNQLINLLELCQKGDAIIVYHTSVFNRNFNQYVKLINQLNEKGIELISITENLNTSQDQTYYPWLKNLAEMEYLVKKNQILCGLDQAKEAGRVGGRPSISVKVQQQITKLYAEQKMPMREIAELCGVSLGTVHKYTNEGK